MDDRPFETINVVPLVDVMLVLLAIVLTTASFIASGRLPVSLPQVAKAEAEKQRHDVIVELPATGEIYFEGKPVNKDSLEDKLKSLRPDASVLLRVDSSSKFQSFVDVADVMKRLRITKVAIQTKIIQR